MSGPKVSVYELSAVEKKRYYEQLEIIKQTEVCDQRVTKTIQILKKELGRVLEVIKTGQEKCSLFGKQTYFLDISQRIVDIQMLIEGMISEQKSIQAAYQKDKAGFVKLSVKMDAQREEKLRALQILVSNIGEKIKETQNLKEEALSRIEEVDEGLRVELHAQMLGGFAVDFSTLRKNQKTEELQKKNNDEDCKQCDEKRRRFTRKINDTLEQVLDRIHSSEKLSGDLKKRFEQIQKLAGGITSPDYIENFYAITVLPFAKDCMEYASLRDQFDSLYDRYIFLCNERKETAKQYICSKENIKKVEEEISRIEEANAQMFEHGYIDEALEEAMEEMGYKIIGRRETVKKSGRRVKHELYYFGDGTGVDVTFGENGHITMELGGFDTQDRVPDASEAERLVEDMHRFCGEYFALERVLEEKGIRRKNISLMPPSADFAQIINTDDYELIKPVSKFVVKKGKKTVSNSKQAE